MINKNRLEGAIRTAGYNQKKLAAELEMSANTFSTKKKNGTFTLAQVERICEICDINDPKDKSEIFLHQ